MTEPNNLSFKKRVLFSVASVCLAWILVEAVLHALTYLRIMPYIPSITPSLYAKDTTKFKVDKHGCPIFVDGYRVYGQLGIPIKPVLLDSEGYRRRFNPSAYQLGFFGDSYTEGLQVDDSETFSRLIEKRLGKDAICFNFGIGGTGTYHQYLRYLTVSQKAKLNDVILCFLPQNDVLNNHETLGKPFELPKSPYLVMRNGAFSEKHPEPDTTHINQRLNWFRSTIGTSFVATGTYRLLKLLTTDAEKHKAEIWQTRTSWLGVYGEPLNADWVEAWQITEEVILRFAKAARDRNSRFTVVILADSLQIGDAAVLNAKIASECDFAYPNRRLKQFCEKHGIVCLDSLPFFLERKRALDYPYFSWKHDGHYSQLGHRTMADFLLSTGRLSD